MELKAGTRLASAVCDGEVVVVKAPAGDVDLRCGGQPMVALGEDKPAGATAAEGLTDGFLIGKRYVDDEAGLELLASKAGQGTLALGDVALVIKGAKPLPASD